MSQPGWPRIADIEVLLIAQQFITVQVDDNGNETTVCAIGRGILRDTLIGAGISLLEKEAGQPLLAAAGATAISHDPPGPRGARFAYPTGGGRLLRLKKPAVGITSVTLNGVPAYEGTDWWGHGPDDTCHTSLEFNVLLVNYTALNYVHHPGTASSYALDTNPYSDGSVGSGLNVGILSPAFAMPSITAGSVYARKWHLEAFQFQNWMGFLMNGTVLA